MIRTSVIAMTLVALLTATSHAQQPADEPPAWQAVAATLPAGAFVEVRLKDGRTFRGTVVEVGAETLRFKPKRFRAVEIAFRDIDSLEPKKAPGMSPWTPVVIGVAIPMIAFIILGAAGVIASN